MLLEPLAPTDLSEPGICSLICYASKFFLLDGKLMHHNPQGHHKVISLKEKHFFFITRAHEIVGHRAIFLMLSNLRKRFWWPMLDDDVKWFVSTCHPCQTHKTHHLHLPPTIPDIPMLFCKVHKNTMLMLTINKFAILSRPAALYHLGLSGALFGKKMRRPLGILYSKISSADREEWLRLLLTMALHLWLWLNTCQRNMASITSRFPLITPRPTALLSANT